MKRKIAVIGAGLSGLAAAWHILERDPQSSVTIFDKTGVGAGASGVASGLFHPYPGEKGRRSKYALEALEETNKLLELVGEHCFEKGIVRIALNEDQRETFMNHGKQYGDVERLSDFTFTITSGKTVHVPLYLKGLCTLLETKGAIFSMKNISSLSTLDAFDLYCISSRLWYKSFFFS